MADLPVGVVQLAYERDGWYLLRIGRAKRTARVYLSDAMLRQLLDQAAALLPGQDVKPR